MSQTPAEPEADEPAELEEYPEFVREFNDLSFSDRQFLLTGKRPDPTRNY